MAEFTDVEIIALDENQTFQADKALELFTVYFELSSAPSYKWRRFFLTECAKRKAAKKDMWRDTRIEGKYIVISAPLDEIQKVHHKNLVADVKQSNANYRAWLDRMAQKQDEIFAEEEREQQKIADLKKKLKL